MAELITTAVLVLIAVAAYKRAGLELRALQNLAKDK